MDRIHLYIAGTGVLIFGFVGLVQWISVHQVKVNILREALTYLKFIWANFLKPHDKNAEDQQDALESFYKTQVREQDSVIEASKLTRHA